jgi:hypothetical protein
MTFFEWFYKNLIIESIFVLVVVCVVLFTKYFAKDTFLELKKFYEDNMISDTSISEVIDSAI